MHAVSACGEFALTRDLRRTLRSNRSPKAVEPHPSRAIANQRRSPLCALGAIGFSRFVRGEVRMFCALYPGARAGENGARRLLLVGEPARRLAVSFATLVCAEGRPPTCATSMYLPETAGS